MNDDYQRYEVEQKDILQREDELAATFVDKVIVEREQQHNEGWEKYNEMAAKERSGISPTSRNRTATSSAVPGPRLRRVLEAGLSGVSGGISGGVSGGVSGGRNKTPSSPQSQALAMYSTPATPSGGILSRGSKRTQSRPSASVHFSPQFPSAPGSPTVLSTPGSPTPSMTPSMTPSINTPSSSHKSSNQSAFMSSPTYKSHNVMPGLSYLKDVPGGLGDSVERFMKAAALRVFVPKVCSSLLTPLFLYSYISPHLISSHLCDLYISRLSFLLSRLPYFVCMLREWCQAELRVKWHSSILEHYHLLHLQK